MDNQNFSGKIGEKKVFYRFFLNNVTLKWRIKFVFIKI